MVILLAPMEGPVLFYVLPVVSNIGNEERKYKNRI